MRRMGASTFGATGMPVVRLIPTPEFSVGRGGIAYADGRIAGWRSACCSEIDRWLVRRAGACSSTSRKPRPSWRRLAVAWPAGSTTEASSGSAERRNNWDRNQLCEHHTGRERGSRTNDSPKKRVCTPFFLVSVAKNPLRFRGKVCEKTAKYEGDSETQGREVQTTKQTGNTERRGKPQRGEQGHRRGHDKRQTKHQNGAKHPRTNTPG